MGRKNPTWCEKRHGSLLLQVMAECGSSLDSTSLSKMPYADATLREVLRFEAIVGISYRRVLKTFECGGYTFPKVMHCSVCDLLCLATSYCILPAQHLSLVVKSNILCLWQDFCTA